MRIPSAEIWMVEIDEFVIHDTGNKVKQ